MHNVHMKVTVKATVYHQCYNCYQCCNCLVLVVQMFVYNGCCSTVKLKKHFRERQTVLIRFSRQLSLTLGELIISLLLHRA